MFVTCPEQEIYCIPVTQEKKNNSGWDRFQLAPTSFKLTYNTICFAIKQAVNRYIFFLIDVIYSNFFLCSVW